jgi:hypothetical protein
MPERGQQPSRSIQQEDIMGTYVISYYGEPTFTSPEAGATYQKDWQRWMGGLGKALVNPGVPLKRAKTVRASGLSDDTRSPRLTGYSILQADSIDAAIEMAKGCPHLQHGTVDVAEAMSMGM